MGMDLYGKKPANTTGKNFRNSVWSWHPLAEYIELTAPEIASRCKYWHSNDGAGLNAKDSRTLAAVLRDELATGRTQEYAEAYKRGIQAMEWIECDLCHGTGTRSDAIGIENGMHERLCPTADPMHPRAGKKGWCNGCNGVGKREPFQAHYPFSVENVSEFAEFLENCGGFEIY